MDQTTMTKVIQSQSMESIELQSDDVNEMRPCNPLTSDPLTDLMGINRTDATFEPLKVCLDDDSSIEDGDEDMFDDDAFYFGDEDFQALLSRIPAKTPVVGHNRVQNSFLPLHNNVSPTTEPIGSQDQIQCIESAASSTTGGMTSSGPSSSGKVAFFDIEYRMNLLDALHALPCFDINLFSLIDLLSFSITIYEPTTWFTLF